MVRRVKAYLKNMKVITDEEKLLAMSMECEPPSGGTQIAQPSVLRICLLHRAMRSILAKHFQKTLIWLTWVKILTIYVQFNIPAVE